MWTHIKNNAIHKLEVDFKKVNFKKVSFRKVDKINNVNQVLYKHFSYY
jgi:hypothetical protein